MNDLFLLNTHIFHGILEEINIRTLVAFNLLVSKFHLADNML